MEREVRGEGGASMGLTYSNMTVRGPTQEAVKEYLASIGQGAFVSPTVDGLTVVYHDDFDLDFEYAADFSRRFSCPVLVVHEFDNDLLNYQLYDAGQFVDDYDSAPDYFDESKDSAPSGGDAQKLCAAFGLMHLVDQVNAVLRHENNFSDDPAENNFLSGPDLHDNLVAALGLPPFASLQNIGWDDTDSPAMAAAGFVHVSTDASDSK
jgi:hypothetical protein